MAAFTSRPPCPVNCESKFLERIENGRDDLIEMKCKICGRIHRTFHCESGKFGLVMK